MHILLADDDRMSVKLTTFLLESSGYTVTGVSNGQAALDAFANAAPDLVLLDVDMSGIDGFDVCRQIRTFSDVPIMFLSGRSELSCRVHGLQIGGDDYLVKPYEPIELLARIEVLLRRRDHDGVVPFARLRIGDMVLDPVEHKVVFVDGRSTELTPVEFRLLYYLMKNAGRVLSPDQILNKVWQDEGGGTNLVAVYIRRLRSKIEADVQRPRYITTLPNLGYRFEARQVMAAA
ncbi:MAG: response regulator transcription factor [Roseiflexaceae bacterium]